MITRTGGAVAGAAVVLTAAGTAADYPELVVLGAAGFAALLLAALWMLARPRLDATRQISPARVREGDPAVAVLRVTNVAHRRSLPLLVTENIAGSRVSVPLPSLAAGAFFETRYPVPTARRGRHEIPPLRVGHADPLRLLHLSRGRGPATALVVHPRSHVIAPLPLGGPRDVEGPTSSNSPQGGVSFHSLRDYQPDDDWRAIHWASSARTGTLMVRRNVIPDEPRHLVVLDTSEGPYTDESFEDAVRVAASLCEAAGEAGYTLDLRTTGHPITEGLDDGVTGALDRLAGIERGDGDRGLLALTDLVTDLVSADEGVALSVVTGRADATHLDALTALRRWFLTVNLIQLGQPGELAAAHGVLAIDARTSADFAAKWNQLIPL
ncbi:Protein of unknown function DUF58 [Amycolatopsis xylanica]|uniref:DUF58 domain-containing protein n=1 Tax=Amycolatopsis xylanica TaxID=589385 RepID=A0A1H3PEH8_9PSEU|nr:DUF58 domain-containing protein [Amycolatopsis xylanica]SDY98799.1 Protein of unknown function DUF58 [Amycolatopsis xylanica]